MKLIKINFAAFGPFTEKTLVFTPDDNGLHIIYGPNETGKSSSLRGLKALLYGFEARTSDDFIHKSTSLRIEGSLQSSNGKTFEFKRRKGNKDTLLSMDGEALEDATLTPFLEGVNKSLFETLFGIDHQALRQGGQDIFEQKGDTGQALFSASIGGTTLHTVLDQLKREADDLFTPSGSTRTINTAIRKHKELSASIKSESLSSGIWSEHKKSLERTQKESKATQAKLDDKRMELTQLERIKRVSPQLIRRQALCEKLNNLGDTVTLSSDFKERREKAFAERDTAEALRKQSDSRLESLKQKCSDFNVREEILEHSKAIEQIHAQLDYYYRIKQNAPKTQAEYEQLHTAVKSQLAEIRPDISLEYIEGLRSTLANKIKITELVNQHSKVDTLVKKNQSDLNKTQVHLDSKRKKLQDLPDASSASALVLTVSAARKLGNIDHTITTQEKELNSLAMACDVDLKKLTLWSGALTDITTLPVPSIESIQRFDREFTELKQNQQRLEDKQEEFKSRLQDCTQQLDTMKNSGKVPTEKELKELREEREQAWQLLRRQWINGDDIKADAERFDSGAPLPEAFERRVKNADEIADRLRREDKRVHTQATLLADLKSIKEQIDDNNKAMAKCISQVENLTKEWNNLWAACSLSPLPPREMETWLNKLSALDAKLTQHNILNNSLTENSAERTRHITHLQQHLTDLGQTVISTENIAMTLEQCQSYLDKVEQNNQERKLLSNEISNLESTQLTLNTEGQQAANELSSWNDLWAKAIEDMSNGDCILPSEAIQTLENLSLLFKRYDEFLEIKSEIQLDNESMQSFFSDAAELIGKAAPDLSKLPTMDAVTRLNTLLLENRTHHTQQLQLQEQVTLAGNAVSDSTATIQTMDDRLEKLCFEAKCTKPEDLIFTEQKSLEHASLQAEVEQIESSLHEEGLPLVDLEAECTNINYDTLPGKTSTLATEIKNNIEPRSLELGIDIGRGQKEMELMDGGDNAAILADEGQSILAEIQSKSEQYIRLKLAHKILNDEVERYKKENQNPIIKRASEFFTQLTKGSFSAIATEYDKRDESILVGVRSDGSQVTVDGMSRGTLDQLYLSLRLATLEQHMEKSSPMPFVVDDILVDFDDERTEAALQVLAEFAKNTQVIMFTHHTRLVEQAGKLKGHTNVYLHELGDN